MHLIVVRFGLSTHDAVGPRRSEYPSESASQRGDGKPRVRSAVRVARSNVSRNENTYLKQ